MLESSRQGLCVSDEKTRTFTLYFHPKDHRVSFLADIQMGSGIRLFLCSTYHSVVLCPRDRRFIACRAIVIGKHDQQLAVKRESQA